MTTEVRMSQRVVSLIQAMSGVASVTTAVIALVIALRVDARASTRFRTQLDLTQKLAIANIKPVLGLVTAEFSNLKSIQLVNYGTGTAVITKVVISKVGRVERNVADLFSFEVPITWDNYWTVTDDVFYLRAGQSLILARVSAQGLLADGFDVDGADRILRSWQAQLEGVRVDALYEDALGNKLPDYSRTLRS
jgi:hypothetical protein